MSKLKGKKPEMIEKRLKMLVYGASGIGKTTACIQFPNAYIIDTEHGTDFYAESINKAGSVVFASNIASEIKQELELLLTEKHSYKTVIIDPITILYQSIQEEWTRRFEKEAIEKNKSANADMQDFGMRYWGKVKSEYKSIQRLLNRLDMNVIVTSHQKDVYGQNMQKLGVSFDSMKGDDYFFDNVIRLEKRGKDRFAVVEKERAEIGKNKFPAEFEWGYSNFIKFYGNVIEKEVVSSKLASPEQVAKITQLLDVVKIEDSQIAKWFAKEDVDDWHDFSEDNILKCIEYVEKKLKGEK
jgi:GTPase SAR1 family protein